MHKQKTHFFKTFSSTRC